VEPSTFLTRQTEFIWFTNIPAKLKNLVKLRVNGLDEVKSRDHPKISTMRLVLENGGEADSSGVGWMPPIASSSTARSVLVVTSRTTSRKSNTDVGSSIVD
jgi:hypothetical protein